MYIEGSQALISKGVYITTKVSIYQYDLLRVKGQGNTFLKPVYGLKWELLYFWTEGVLIFYKD